MPLNVTVSVSAIALGYHFYAQQQLLL